MMAARNSRVLRTISLLITVCLVGMPAHAKYGGGSGTADDPYQIATAVDLMALGDSPEDYEKHFIVTADIDLDPSLPNRKVFDKAVIASFTGIFDGNGHTISHLTVKGAGNLGLFGFLPSGAEVKNLGLVDVNILGSGDYVGGLVGTNGTWSSGGGVVTGCYSTGAVTGTNYVGGLVGGNLGVAGSLGTVTQCYSTGTVTGTSNVGGLVGGNFGPVTQCYSTGTVSGTSNVGGLVGFNFGSVIGCFWDIQTSGQGKSAGGTGKTTAEMHTAGTFLGWWYGSVWTIDEGKDYPRLYWQGMPGELIASPYGGGGGTPADPYLIHTADQLNAIGLVVSDWDKHFRLMADIDLSGFDGKEGRPAFTIIGTYETSFTGLFDGNGHTISHLTIQGVRYLGLFGRLVSGAEVKNLGVIDVNITGSGSYVGGLAGSNGIIGGAPGGVVTGCYSTGVVSSAGSNIGGLLGLNSGRVTRCYSAGVVTGSDSVGGLVGYGGGGTVTQCYSAGVVSGSENVGGLLGWGSATNCYSTAAVNGNFVVGGLVGRGYARVTQCYSTGAVKGSGSFGGLLGAKNDPWGGEVVVSACFWDVQTSSQATSAGGTGKTTTEMQMLATFTGAGWDFVGELANGTADTWRMCVDGAVYPRLTWEYVQAGDFVCPDGVDTRDLSALCEDWLLTYAEPLSGADANGDAVVTFEDFAVLAENWLAGVE